MNYFKTIFRITKLFFVLCLVCTFQAFASSYSQTARISLAMHDVKIEEVLDKIEEQSEFYFLYNQKLVDLNKKVSIIVSDETINEVLSDLFVDKKIDFAVYDRQIILSPTGMLGVPEPGISQQTITIKGTVTDAEGDPLPGVSIKIKGTSQGTATDSNGAYTLSVADENATLVFSYIGYFSQETVVGSRRSINITLLDDTRTLEEVVVIGYGTVKKANLTGAVGFIDNKQLENRAVLSLTQALQGKVSGLTVSSSNGGPGSEQKLNLRGYTGLGTMGEPLIVIDGVQAPNNALSYLEMNDVENISFLKDAASSAIYGSSAPYGVVLVTTKKGKVGKPVINYNNNFGFSRPINIPHYRNTNEFAEMYNWAKANGGQDPVYTAAVVERIRQYNAGIITTETIPTDDGTDWQNFWAANGNNDWFEIFLNKTSFSQRHNVSASGASENTNYYIGLGYTQQDGLLTVGREDDKRYNARINISTNLTKWLTFGARTSFSRQMVDIPAEYGFINVGVNDNSLTNYAYGIINSMGNSAPTWVHINPLGGYSEYGPSLAVSEGGRRKFNTDNFSITGEFIIKPLPGWDITGSFTYDNRNIDAFNHNKTLYVTRPNGSVTASSRTVPNSMWRQYEKYQNYTINAFTSYEKSLGSHYFKGMVGFSQVLNTWQMLRGSNNYLLDDQTPMLSLTYGTATVANDNAWEFASRGAFGRIQYNFQEKYLLEINGRYDGTSKYMKDYRMKFYPGASAAWVVSKEAFWEPLTSYLNVFKLRASYASLGDQNASGLYDFYPALRSTLSTNTNWIFSGSTQENFFRQPASLVNPSLTWITMNTLGFAVDLAAFQNRLEFSFDWFRRRMKDYLGPSQAFPAMLGVEAPRENNTDLETKGFELTLGWKDRINDFGYGLTFNLSDFKGEIIKYPDVVKMITGNYTGKKQGEIWGFETIGLINNDVDLEKARNSQSLLAANWQYGDVLYRSFSADGKLTRGESTVDNPGDQRIIGNRTPRYQYGFTLSLDWKGFDAQVFIQGVGKRDVLFDKWNTFFWGITDWGEWQTCYFTVHDFWSPENTNGYLPRPYFNTDKNLQNQTRYLQNGAYLRLKNIQLGYTIPKSLTSKIYFSNARLFVNVENIATFSHMSKIIDPELAGMDAILYDGMGGVKRYPLRRTVSLGFNVTF